MKIALKAGIIEQTMLSTSRAYFVLQNNFRKGPAVVPSPTTVPALGCAHLNRSKTGHFLKETVTGMLSIVAQARGTDAVTLFYLPYCSLALAFPEVTCLKSQNRCRSAFPRYSWAL